MTNTMNPEKAWLYEKYRLPYADAAVDDLLERVGTPQQIADIGAGTGQLARMFAKRCETVFAIEPDAAMRQVASSVLATLAGVDIRDGTAEQTTLGNQSVELIVVGNAFHRFRPECSDEFRRILKPNGWIALYSYRFINQEFAGMLFPRLARLRRIADRIDKAWHKTPTETLFGVRPLARLRYRQIQREDWTAFLGSACSGIEAPDRQDPEYSDFEAINREVFATFAADGEIAIDYETEVVYGKPA